MYIKIYNTYKLVESFKIDPGYEFNVMIKCADGTSVELKESDAGYVIPKITGFKGDKTLYGIGKFLDGNMLQVYDVKQYLAKVDDLFKEEFFPWTMEENDD